MSFGADGFSRVGNALGMVTGRARDDTQRSFLGRERVHFIERASQFEASGELLVFHLEVKLGAGNLKRRRALSHARASDLSAQEVARALNIGKRDSRELAFGFRCRRNGGLLRESCAPGLTMLRLGHAPAHRHLVFEVGAARLPKAE